jgi:hypothetical protein
VTLLPVWFLAHPVAGDERYTYENNMGMHCETVFPDTGHVIKCLRMCYSAGFHAIAPYYELCLALDDSNSDDRAAGMLTGLTLIKGLGRLILAGHKIASGMEQEVAACCEVGGQIINLVGVPDKDFVSALRIAVPQRILRTGK